MKTNKASTVKLPSGKKSIKERAKNFLKNSDETLDAPTTNPVESVNVANESDTDSEPNTNNVINNDSSTKDTTMTLTLKNLDKRGRYGIYTGAAVAIRVPIAAFPDRTAPPSFTAEGFAEKVAKVKLTPEERKAARAAKPKLTLAEKVAKAEERAAKLRASLAAASEAPAGDQPSA